MKFHTVNVLSLFIISFFLATLTSCGDNTKPTPSGSGKKIKIQSFAASKTEVGIGESFKLSWEVTNAESVSIDNGIGDNLVLTGEHEVSSIDHTTVYTLTAKNKNEEITQKLTIALKVSDDISAPVIVAFESSSTELTCGDSITLSWETKNATKVTITPNDDCDTSKKDHGNCEVFPARKTTYKITAENESGNLVQQEVTIQVKASQATILEFSADPGEVEAGNSSTISWKTTCANRITITRNDTLEEIVDTDSLTGTASVTPDHTTQYTIKAHYSDSGQTKTIERTIEIKILPSIIHFTANPETVNDGEPAELSWKTLGATSITLSKTIGNNPPKIIQDVLPDKIGNPEPEVFQVFPSEKTVYRIEAKNTIGDTTQKEVTVDVLPFPRIETFSSDKTDILIGESIILTWKVLGDVTGVSITGPDFNGIQPDEFSGSTTVQPSKSGKYTLTAQGSRGDATKEILVKVWQKVIIKDFVSNPKIITKGQSSLLSFSVDNATSVEVTDANAKILKTQKNTDGSNISANVSVSPNSSSVYTIKASNPVGSEATATADVLVDPAQITSISANPTHILAGQSSTIQYTSDGSFGIQVYGADGDVMAADIPYNWDDILITGTSVIPYGLSSSTQNTPNWDAGKVSNIPLGFHFRFYGKEYDQVFISTDGLLSFENFTSALFPSSKFPFNETSSSDPKTVVAPFWDDLSQNSSQMKKDYDKNDGYTKIIYETKGTAPNRRFITTWYRFAFYSYSTPTVQAELTFQVILYEIGAVQFNYQTLTGHNDADGRGASIGLNKGSETKGVSYLYKGKDPSNNSKTVATGVSVGFGPNILSADGQVIVQPQKTTTYTVVALDMLGYHDAQEVTVFVLQPNSIIVNEFMASGSAGDWIELYNNSDETINLKDWKIRDNGGEEATLKTTDTFLDPKSFFLIALGNTAGLNPDVSIGSGFTLDTVEDEIIIGVSSLDVNRVDYNAAWIIESDKSALLIRGAYNDNNNKDRWCVGQNAIGNGNFGTPKAMNESCGGVNGDLCNTDKVTLSSFTQGNTPADPYTITTSGNTAFAADDIGFDQLNCINTDHAVGNGPDVFYTFSVPQGVTFENITAKVSATGSTWYPKIAILPAQCLYSPSIACGKSGTSSAEDILSIAGPFQSGETYDLVIDSENFENSGTFDLSIVGTPEYNVTGYSITKNPQGLLFIDISTDSQAVLESDFGTGGKLKNDDDTKELFVNTLSFNFYGNSYSSLWVNTNGIITFGASSGAWSNKKIPDSVAPNNIIAAYWDDLGVNDMSNSNSSGCNSLSATDPGYCPYTGKIYTLVSGTTPNRVWTILWKDFNRSRYISSNNGAKGMLNFSVNLYEGTGIIELVYGTLINQASTTDGKNSVNCQTATIGIENDDGSNGEQYCFDGKDSSGNSVSVVSNDSIRFTPIIN